MSQLYELWKKLKHKLADRQFLLSLLPALLIALYLAGLLIHAAYNGVRIMFSANTSAEPIWNWNPFVAISSVFSPFGIFFNCLCIWDGFPLLRPGQRTAHRRKNG